MKSFFLISTVVSSITVGVAHADVTYSGCFDVFGQAVPTIVNANSPWLARAQSVNDGKSVIILNPKLMKPFSKNTQRVIYWHECGHIALAHMLKGNPITPFQEQEADCFGIRSAITIGEIKLDDVGKVQSDFASLGPGDWQHLSGAARSVNLKSCLNNGLNENSWSNCKKDYYANTDLIQKSVGMLKQMKAICKKFKGSSSECGEARKLSDDLKSGIYKTLGVLDRDCAYIVDPKFMKFMAPFQEALLQIKMQK